MRQTRRMNDDALLGRLAALEIETPSWGYGNSGTRFHVYPWPGAARTVWERIDDAALVHQLTGCCPSVALHIPWDMSTTGAPLRDYATDAASLSARSTRISSATTHTGSAASATRTPPSAESARPLPRVRRDRHELGSKIVSLWLADGTNYPGQDDLRGRPRRLVGGPRGALRALPPGSGCSSSTSSSSPPSTAPICPTGARRPWSAGSSARRRRCSSTPATIRRARTSSRSWPSCWLKGARRLPLQQPQVRRRRPDRRLDRPVRALPDHARDRARGGANAVDSHS